MNTFADRMLIAACNAQEEAEKHYKSARVYYRDYEWRLASGFQEAAAMCSKNASNYYKCYVEAKRIEKHVEERGSR